MLMPRQQFITHNRCAISLTMPHIVFQPDLDVPNKGDLIRIIGPEAHHAVRVKRLEIGHMLALRNGRGLVAEAKINDIQKTRQGEWAVDVRVEQSNVIDKPAPQLRVYSAAAKGDRLEEIIDGLSQVGATSWRPITSSRSIVEPRSGKLERLARVAEEALKQSGRAWMLDIGPMTTFADALSYAQSEKSCVLLADQSGTPWRDLTAEIHRTTSHICLFIGPEGGWTDQELSYARNSDVKVVSFGPHVMRIEVAAIAGAAAVMQSLQ